MQTVEIKEDNNIDPTDTLVKNIVVAGVAYLLILLFLAPSWLKTSWEELRQTPRSANAALEAFCQNPIFKYRAHPGGPLKPRHQLPANYDNNLAMD